MNKQKLEQQINENFSYGQYTGQYKMEIIMLQEILNEINNLKQEINNLGNEKFTQSPITYQGKILYEKVGKNE